MEGHILDGRVLLKDASKKEKIGSIYIPKTVEEQKEGEVMISTCEASVGDVVIFKSEGTEVKINEETYRLIMERDILYIK